MMRFFGQKIDNKRFCEKLISAWIMSHNSWFPEKYRHEKYIIYYWHNNVKYTYNKSDNKADNKKPDCMFWLNKCSVYTQQVVLYTFTVVLWAAKKHKEEQ